MATQAKPVGERRYRESFGRYFGGCRVGNMILRAKRVLAAAGGGESN